MCRIAITPLYPKRSSRIKLQKSRALEQARPATSISLTMQRNKTPSIPAGAYVSPLSRQLLSSSVTSSAINALDFPDHYALLGLDNRATSEEIQEAHRQLRDKYFTTDACKYQALRETFIILADCDARREYDVQYRNWKGSPKLPVLEQPSQAPLPRQSSNYARNDKEVLDKVPAHGQVQEEAAIGEVQYSTIEEASSEYAERKAGDVAKEEGRKDPCWGLKNFSPKHKPVLGSKPYESFIPIQEVYEGRKTHPSLKCRRPKYVGVKAKNSLPK